MFYDISCCMNNYHKFMQFLIICTIHVSCAPGQALASNATVDTVTSSISTNRVMQPIQFWQQLFYILKKEIERFAEEKKSGATTLSSSLVLDTKLSQFFWPPDESRKCELILNKLDEIQQFVHKIMGYFDIYNIEKILHIKRICAQHAIPDDIKDKIISFVFAKRNMIVISKILHTSLVDPHCFLPGTSILSHEATLLIAVHILQNRHTYNTCIPSPDGREFFPKDAELYNQEAYIGYNAAEKMLKYISYKLNRQIAHMYKYTTMSSMLTEGKCQSTIDSYDIRTHGYCLVEHNPFGIDISPDLFHQFGIYDLKLATVLRDVSQ